jgi:hypothetical protein
MKIHLHVGKARGQSMELPDRELGSYEGTRHSNGDQRKHELLGTSGRFDARVYIL